MGTGAIHILEVENLTVDAAMGWVQLPAGGLGMVNGLQAYVRVRDAEGIGVAGLTAANFRVVRLSAWAAHLAGSEFPIQVTPADESIPNVLTGTYVLGLTTAADEGPLAAALSITVRRKVGRFDNQVGQKLVTVKLSPTY